MLSLHSNKYNTTYNNSYYYTNYSEALRCGHDSIRLQNHRDYFRGPQAIGHADLPLHMNNINLKRCFFKYDEDKEDAQTVSEGISDTLLNIFNTIEQDTFTIITGYLAGNSLLDSNFDYSFIDKDLWKEHKDDSIKSLYNKCIEQTSVREMERQSRDIQQHLRLFQSKTKHIVLMLTDYEDVEQESETFLTIGLTPIFFEDWKDRFEQEEIEYFKVLINRSQVKRISNVKASNQFQILESLEKYHILEREIRYQTLFKNVAEARIRNAERLSNDYRDKMRQALRTYDESYAKVKEFEIIIDKYRGDSEDVIKELQTISKLKGVYDIVTHNSGNGNQLKIILRVPLDYYDMDAAECAIRNIHNANVKRFIEEIFIEQKYKLYIRTDMYYAYTNEANFQDFTSINEGDCININAMFNPHFQFYHCLGDYRPSLIKAMREQDLTMFVNIGIAAARSMNFTDGAVCNRWFNWLEGAFQNDYYLSMKCIEKDNKLYTLGQWLNNSFEETPEPIRVIEVEDL